MDQAALAFRSCAPSSLSRSSPRARPPRRSVPPQYRIEISPRYGKKRSLQLVKKTMAIGDFIDDVYLPTLEKFINDLR